jgi:two-component system, cell cycle response regulator CpdR
LDQVIRSVQNTPERILIVEDDAELCALLEDLLSDEGYEVSSAVNDEAAYAELRRDWQSIDALVVDINLGRGTTGFDVARFARRLNDALPVIYLTGGSPQSVSTFGVEGGVLVSKPFDRELFLNTLQAKLRPGQS